MTDEQLDLLTTWLAGRLAPIGLDCCVLATSILVDALRTAGVPVEPVSVRTTIWNPAAWRLYQVEMVDPGSPEGQRRWIDEGARMIGLGYPGALADPSRARTSGYGWKGHLVAMTETALLDPTLPQANDLTVGLELPPILLKPTPEFRERRGPTIGKAGDWHVVYEQTPDNTEWANSPDWLSPQRAFISEQFLNELRRGACPSVRL